LGLPQQQLFNFMTFTQGEELV